MIDDGHNLTGCRYDGATRRLTCAQQNVASGGCGLFEIEVHTDSTGSPEYNEKLGEERAMAVRDYIAKKYGVALSRLNEISYGKEKPVADNKTREGRAENRRVVIRILE